MLRNGEQGDSPQVSVCAHLVSPASSADHGETSLEEWQQSSLLCPMSEGTVLVFVHLCSSASCKRGKKREKWGKKWGGDLAADIAAAAQGRSQ